MEFQAEQDTEYNDIVETLTSMFGNVISKEVIFAIVENCGGDLNMAAEAVMNMSSDVTDDSTKQTTSKIEIKQQPNPEPAATENRPQASQTLSSTPGQNLVYIPEYKPPPLQAAMSYSGASRCTGAVPKQVPKPRPPPTIAMVWTDQIRQIVTHHNRGSRILILMRGAPGSGKSYLANQIVEMTIGSAPTDYNTHILSTDDFFMVRGVYQYQRNRLSEAHDWNQNRACRAMRQGLSPIIIDNTNILIWEMEPYVREGVRNGYIVEVVEPNTPWAKKTNQLMRKNTHNVPSATIKRMLENYQDGVTGAYLKKFYGLCYPADKNPPVPRTKPEFIPPQVNLQPKSLTMVQNVDTQSVDLKHDPVNYESGTPVSTQLQKEARISNFTEELTDPIEVISEEEELAQQNRYLEFQKQMKEMENVEEQWENGESWEKESQETTKTTIDIHTALEPRPQRCTNSEGSTQSSPRENLLHTVPQCDDWRKISLFMPSWTNEASLKVDECIELPVRETTSTSTCVEVGDTILQNPKQMLKVITATPRDINIFNISSRKEKIPAVRMLDKSTATNELLITEAYRCNNEEQHFLAFRKLFKNIPRASLRDIFDKCCGDVNWAVDIVLGGMVENQIETLEGCDISDTEDDAAALESCDCLAAYQIIPDAASEPAFNSIVNQNIPSITISTESNVAPVKKGKISPSDSNLQLKREIEKNIVISDDHYSQHTLKLRKWRRGESSDSVPDQSGEIETASEIPPKSSTSGDITKEDIQQTKEEAVALSDDEESNTSSLDEVERTININVGYSFIAQLDELFGRRGMTYPKNIAPRINIPISLLNEINAFWMESLMCQLDEQDKQNYKMLREDAEFASQLEKKEAELVQQGREPEVPDLKEIMDLEFALSVYQKDVAEWRSTEPTDMAAKLSRDKLYNLFPDMSADVLSELLMAHDNNFQATVEVLLMSTGNAHILEEKNGLNKFVMEKELERQKKLLEEEKKALSEVEWPLLPQGEKVDLSVVENYREEAEKHLLRRNLNYQKAQESIRRGMPQIADYYSGIASFHKQKYEQANSLAAVSLMQVHASKAPDNATIDLHYLRVGEAKESLDLFLDTHIQKLREGGHKGVRQHTLFFITGRGLHSGGRPRVKPAVKRRLRERGLAFRERNPGLLTAKVCADDKLSYQVNVP